MTQQTKQVTEVFSDGNKHPQIVVADKMSAPDMVFTYDPLKKFQRTDTHTITLALGVLIPWAINILHAEEPTTFKRVYESSYDFGVVDMVGGEIDGDGVYNYPEDRPLYPLACTEYGNEKLYFYEYAMVGTVNTETGEQWLTRLD